MASSKNLRKRRKAKLTAPRSIVRIIWKGRSKMSEFREFLNEQLKGPELKAEYDALEPEFAIIRAMIDARERQGITQKELAARTGIAQADISKLENGNANPSIRTLKRLASGLGCRLKIEFATL